MAENQHRLRIIPLGGVDEFGKNITVVEYGEDIIVVDCGSIFPKEDMLGVDLVIPDVTYLIKNRHRIRGLIITHGHEDHIGATPYVLRQVPMPLYGTKLAMALVDLKLKEHRVGGIPLQVIKPNDEITLGCFKIRFIHVNHSIAGSVGLAIETPVGVVVMSGDFKVDYTPIEGKVTDLAAFGELGNRGVLAFMCESTNVGREGYTMSESKIGQTFVEMFQKAPGRVFVAMFASNVHRVQSVIDSAVLFGRKVCFVGRSMVNVSRVAMSIGEMVIPEGTLIEIDEINNYPENEIAIITTGSQGEAMAGLTRMAYSEHRKVQIRPSDTIILSASPIPGNEKPVARVINQLYRCGANVIYGKLGEVHVSGHACREEIKLLHALVRPKYFIPYHGEYANLWQHAELAESLGTLSQNIVIPEVGQVIEMDQESLAITGLVPTGGVLVDGLGIGDVGNVVLRDRKHLSQDGLIIVAISIERDSGTLSSGPEIISRGFVYVRENEDIIEYCRELVRNIVMDYQNTNKGEWQNLKNRVKDELHRYIFEKIKRNPMILPIVMEI